MAQSDALGHPLPTEQGNEQVFECLPQSATCSAQGFLAACLVRRGETASLCHRFPPQPCVPWGFSWHMLTPLCVRVLSAQTPHLQKPGQSGYPGLQAAGAPPESRLRDRGCGAGAWSPTSLVASQLEHSCLRWQQPLRVRSGYLQQGQCPLAFGICRETTSPNLVWASWVLLEQEAVRGRM